MPIKERLQALYDLFILIRAYFSCPEEIYVEGRDTFELTIIQSLRYAKTGKKSW